MTTKEKKNTVDRDEPEQIVQTVRERYGAIAETGSAGCCTPATSCGGSDSEQAVALGIGYTPADLDLLPDGANLGLGCGAPITHLELQPGESVLDLGSGAGIDAILAARSVGSNGRVIGVDMTPEMLAKARDNAAAAGLDYVEFREGRLEAMPVDDNSVDALTSNCVINLVPDKRLVFEEIQRVLRPGGRVVISDIVLDGELPEVVTKDVLAYVGCVAGAMRRENYFGMLREAGLTRVEIIKDVDFLASTKIPGDIAQLMTETGFKPEDVEGIVRSVTYRAYKPA
jgi:SAM-dependent methyltransferase